MRLSISVKICFTLILFCSFNSEIDFKKNLIGATKKSVISYCGYSYEEGVNKLGQKYILYEISKFEGSTFYFDKNDICIFASYWLNERLVKDCKNFLSNNFKFIRREGSRGAEYSYYESPNVKYRLFDGASDGGILDVTSIKNQFVDN